MPDATVIEWIRGKYIAIIADLDERGRRRWAAAEATSLGWGGISAVAKATGVSDRTIRTGIRELEDPDPLPSTRQRKPGGGRRRREDEQPKLLYALKKLVELSTRGDPMSPLRWTCKSTRTLARELNRQGFLVSSTKVSLLLREQAHGICRWFVSPSTDTRTDVRISLISAPGSWMCRKIPLVKGLLDPCPSSATFPGCVA